ncbi:MAG TPA: hypothetical protein VFE78_21055, partial [Gemmataceae bacterium]|nr:hypothetical protein [Gemmataceae bacterium]
ETVVRRWEVAGWKELKALEGSQGIVLGLAFTPDGKQIATCSDNSVRLWSTDGRMQRRLAEGREHVRCLALSPDGKKVAAGYVEGTLAVWDTRSGRELARWRAGHSCLVGLTFSPDGKVLASAAVGESDVRLWEAATGKRLSPTAAPGGAVRRLAFSPDGRRLAAVAGGLRDEAISLWDVGAWKERARIADPVGEVSGIAFSADGKVLAAAHGNPTGVLLWDADSGQPRGRLPGQGPCALGVAASPVGSDLTWSDGAALAFWDTKAGKERLRVRTPSVLRQVAYSPDGRLVAAFGNDHALHLWDAATGEKLRAFGQKRLGMEFLTFSPDGRMLVTPADPPRPGTPGSEVCLWEAATGAERCCLRGHERGVAAAAFSPDGRLLATAGWGERIARLWEVATGKELRRLAGHRGDIHALAFSPDGKLLAAGDSDSTVLIWDVPALVPPRPLPAGDLTAEQLSGLWADLTGADAGRAYRAIAGLADHPTQAGPFLRGAVKRLPLTDGKLLARLIADLDADEFAAREKASKGLAALGAAAPALKEALRGKPSPEAARRLREVLKQIDDRSPSPEKVRVLRAVEALERVGTPPARDALRAVAEDSGDPDVVREAIASLRRLAARPASSP